MAVHTEINEEQLDAIRQGLGLKEIKNLEGVRDKGKADTKYTAVAIDTQGQETAIVITIHETPDISAYCHSVEHSANVAELMKHVATNFVTSANSTAAVLTPMSWGTGTESECSSGIMDFNATKKRISVVPFIVGDNPQRSENGVFSAEQAREIGKALAQFHEAAKGFPYEDQMPNPCGLKAWKQSIDIIAAMDRSQAEKKVGQMLKTQNAVRAKNLGEEQLRKEGKKFLESIERDFDYIQKKWDEVTGKLEIGIIHNDFQHDNMLASEDGKLVILDFGCAGKEVLGLDIAAALNIWAATEEGNLVQENINALLEGYREIKEISTEMESALPLLGLCAAIRCTTIRAEMSVGNSGVIPRPLEQADNLASYWRNEIAKQTLHTDKNKKMSGQSRRPFLGPR